MAGTLVVALTRRGAMPGAVYELLSAGRKLSGLFNEPLAAAVLAAKADAFAQDLIERGADKVFTISHEKLADFNDELHAKAVRELVEKEGFSRVLLPASVAGKALAARLAVQLKAGLASEVFDFSAEGGTLKAKRYHFSGNLIADIEFKSGVQIMTLQAMVFPAAEKQAGRAGQSAAVAFDPGGARTEYVSYQAEESGEVDLAAAERIVSGGRGLGNAEGFKLIRDLAHSIGAAVGASRAVVDSGWIAYRHQVGLTGRAVRPKLYIACGISGQIQHLAGMSSSGTIVAVNTDPQCPMVQLASISVVGDLYEILPHVVAEIKRRKGVPVAA